MRAYQRVQPLTIGELWAVSITLRIVLVENLRRLAEDIGNYQAARQDADLLADRLFGVGGREAGPADAVLGHFFETMHKLERFRGHFYNWYDTRDLRPLDPRYLSSVDSGNLAEHLIVLGNAYRELAMRPMMGTQSLIGIGDSLELMREALREAPDDPGPDVRWHLNEELDSLATLLESAPSAPAGIVTRLKELALHAKTVVDIARESNAAGPEGSSWAKAMHACVLSHQRDLETLMP